MTRYEETFYHDIHKIKEDLDIIADFFKKISSQQKTELDNIKSKMTPLFVLEEEKDA